MARQVVLLRGINLGSRNRIAMPALREALEQAGMSQVRTYVQSGNVVLSSEDPPETTAKRCERTIADTFDLNIRVIGRTAAELAEVVSRNPLGDVAENPKRYQVCFLESELEPAVLEKLNDAVVEPEQLVAVGRELYAWHPEGIARSKLWGRIAGPSLGAAATARNWTTVTTLLSMVEE